VRLGARAVGFGRAAPGIVADSPGAIRDRIRAYADAGVSEIIVGLRPPFDRALLRRFAEEIMPTFK
jgi:alkanesulfonate monooxygenase SsuD/methylene tetrahydromethanopterin reductase-like flavin-dependent oxidoreductase (luciferase family)